MERKNKNLRIARFALLAPVVVSGVFCNGGNSPPEEGSPSPAISQEKCAQLELSGEYLSYSDRQNEELKDFESRLKDANFLARYSLGNEFLRETYDMLSGFEDRLVLLPFAPKDSVTWQNPAEVDFYFKVSEKCSNVQAYLVVDQDFLSREHITSEELAVIITHKALVFDGLDRSLTTLEDNLQSSEFAKHIKSPEFTNLRRNLEQMHWFAIANLTVGPLAQSGKLKSERLEVLLPERVLSSQELLSVDPTQWQEWSQDLPENIFLGLSSR